MKQQFKFVNVTEFSPEQINVLDKDDKLVAFIQVKNGIVECHPYINGEIDWKINLCNLKLDDEWLGAIPNNMRKDIYEYIEHKLSEII